MAGTAVMAQEEVHVLNWQGYGTDEAWAVELFEQQTGYTVKTVAVGTGAALKMA